MKTADCIQYKYQHLSPKSFQIKTKYQNQYYILTSQGHITGTEGLINYVINLTFLAFEEGKKQITISLSLCCSNFWTLLVSKSPNFLPVKHVKPLNRGDPGGQFLRRFTSRMFITR